MDKDLEEYAEPAGKNEEIENQEEILGGDDAIVDEETLSNNNRMSYSPSAEYSSSRLEDLYKPEDHYETVRLHEEMLTAFENLMVTNPEYAFLRSIDVDKVGPGDNIYVDTETDSIGQREKPTNFIICKILASDGENYDVVDEEKDNRFTASRGSLKTIDEYINRLKSSDIAYIYVNIKKNMPSLNSEIIYFDIFSTYFRIHETILYKSLPFAMQTMLLTELDKKTNALKKKDINSMW